MIALFTFLFGRWVVSCPTGLRISAVLCSSRGIFYYYYY